MEKHLWEIKHPYYAAEGNYFSNGEHIIFDTLDEFLEEFEDSDVDMNFIYRWDWKPLRYDDNDNAKWSEDEYYRDGELFIYWIGQRKGKNWSSSVNVCRKDEERVIKFLTPRWENLKKVWNPFI